MQVDFFPSIFLLLRGRGVEVNVFFSPRYMKRWKEEGGEGYIGFFWKCFFHCGEGREGFTGGNFFYKFIVGWGKGCTLMFFFFFFLLLRGRGVEGNVFFLPSFDMWKEEGKGMILFYF